MSGKPILVFPGGMPGALDYARSANSTGFRLIGASSLRFDPNRESYAEWLYLPYVTDPGFDAALAQAVREHDIGGVFTPNPVVWSHLHAALQRIAPGVALVNGSPLRAVQDAYGDAFRRAAQHGSSPLRGGLPGPLRPCLSELQLSGLYRANSNIPGMCDYDKLHALIEIFSSTPSGDVVEIGSWWGKSASALALLSAWHDIGPVLCVDPWSNAHLVQGSDAVDQASASVSADDALRIFEVNMMALGTQNLNYLRLPSVDGARCYGAGEVRLNTALGSARYNGSISLLHIDGNHAFEAVQADLAAWWPFVRDGGWIILDDYRWPYGDGPRRVGDQFLLQHWPLIQCAFVMGGALFMRVQGANSL